ncbi:MAG: metallophosphoesterase family protein [Gemmataceae bacterium]
MRILLLADIHANWPALQAISEPFDQCLVLGDLVDYGLEPGPCIDWVRQRPPTSSAATTITASPSRSASAVRPASSI